MWNWFLYVICIQNCFVYGKRMKIKISQLPTVLLIIFTLVFFALNFNIECVVRKFVYFLYISIGKYMHVFVFTWNNIMIFNWPIWCEKSFVTITCFFFIVLFYFERTPLKNENLIIIIVIINTELTFDLKQLVTSKNVLCVFVLCSRK